ncbi:hypothetical protein [Neorhizobium sp. JUb45]|uniref:hypothetical protein n=1 Tax=unclassified Neorhizobium TaxID=2629175 RepID=UPI00104A0C45|nr:hypothetical protein [Neorhizobium sp. JUb45]
MMQKMAPACFLWHCQGHFLNFVRDGMMIASSTKDRANVATIVAAIAAASDETQILARDVTG